MYFFSYYKPYKVFGRSLVIREMSINIESIENTKNVIEKMSKIHHVEILKIIKKYPTVKLNENKSGVYINLSFLPHPIIEEINTYIHYIQDQESALNELESQKRDFKNTYFTGETV